MTGLFGLYAVQLIGLGGSLAFSFGSVLLIGKRVFPVSGIG
jgi:hypothetical protein